MFNLKKQCEGIKKNGIRCVYKGVSNKGDKWYCKIHYKSVKDIEDVIETKDDNLYHYDPTKNNMLFCYFPIRI